jgi:uncharacterized protein (DUF433 family)
MDWTGCDLVERVPGKCSGSAVVRGTRIFADTIVQDRELGASAEDIHESFPTLSLETIESLLAFAEARHEMAV